MRKLETPSAVGKDPQSKKKKIRLPPIRPCCFRNDISLVRLVGTCCSPENEDGEQATAAKATKGGHVPPGSSAQRRIPLVLDFCVIHEALTAGFRQSPVGLVRQENKQRRRSRDGISELPAAERRGGTGRGEAAAGVTERDRVGR